MLLGVSSQVCQVCVVQQLSNFSILGGSISGRKWCGSMDQGGGQRVHDSGCRVSLSGGWASTFVGFELFYSMVDLCICDILEGGAGERVVKVWVYLVVL